MQYDINGICKFYEGKFGKITSRIVQDEINGIWHNLNGMNILGYGYARPYLHELIMKTPERAVDYIFNIETNTKTQSPNTILKECWTPIGKNLSVIGTQDNLPFDEALFQRIIAIHAIEEAENPRRMLRELWRVLAPEGRIIFIVPNRRGLLARTDNTPFGQGRPYTKTQLGEILSDAMFEVTYAKRIFFMPPLLNLTNDKFANICEKTGQFILPHVGGLLFFEAIKRVAIEPNKVSANKSRVNEIAPATYFSKHQAKTPK